MRWAVAALYGGLAAADIQFSPHVQDHMVLQQAPAKSAVYGSISAPSNTAVSVSITVKGDASYTVDGKVDGSDWVAYLKPTKAGGNYSVTVDCKGCDGNASATISDVTFGEVWYCSGQSNMALPLVHTFSRNKSREMLLAGKHNNIRLHQMDSNMNSQMDWQHAAAAALVPDPRYHNEWIFFDFSATCWYFGEALSDHLGSDTPIGLIHTAWGGSSVQQWSSNDSLDACSSIANVAEEPNRFGELGTWGQFFYDRVMPFAKTTVKGFLWYQGENNMGSLFGNSARNEGYACAVPEMLKAWRAAWSAEPGTTPADAPFGLVTLAPSGSEGHPDMGGMYLAQTGGYGTVPNAAFPNTFMANAFDLGDPWVYGLCNKLHCHPMNSSNPDCKGCEAYDAAMDDTLYYMGPIHPRTKQPLGARLAQGAYGVAYGGDVATSGPVISGCSVKGDKLTISFTNQGGETLKVGDNPTSALQVLTNESYFCLQTKHNSDTCLDDGTGKPKNVTGAGRKYDSPDTWPMVNISSATASSVVVDISSVGPIFGVRYAWMTGFGGQGDCCAHNPPTKGPCELASCPLKAAPSGLPANPFVARIENGKCKCIAPQVCDA